MKARNVRIIFLKEMLETLRDRRTLMVMILGPVLIYPILILVFSQMHSIQEARLQRQQTTVHLHEKEKWPEIRRTLSDDPSLEVLETDGSRLDDRSGVLVELDTRLAKDQNRKVPKITVVYRQADVRSERGKERVLDALQKYAREITFRMIDLTEKERYVHPLIIEENNLSSPSEQVQSVMAMTLPMILVLMTIAGAMYPAIDTTAGEKERGTIETILASPAERGEIVCGKFFSVFVICMATGLLNLAAMSLTFIHVLGGFSGSIVPFTSVVLVLVSLVPLAVLFSALMMAVSTYARTFREAQNYVTPIYLLCLIPAMMSVQRGFELSDFLCIVPVINMSLFFREVMEGTYNGRHILLVFASTSLYAIVALRAAVKLFRDENALFSLEKPFALFVRRRLLRAKLQPSFAEAVFLCAILFILFYYVSPAFQGTSGDGTAFLVGTLFSQWLLILCPALLFARYLKIDFRSTFRLNGFRPIHVLAALLLYVGSFFLLVELAVLQRRLIPMPPEFWERASEGLGEGSFWLAAAAIAISPAICEEIAFRGFVLAGFHRLSPWARILLNGGIFALFHVLVFRLLPTAFLGVVIAFIVLSSGSIFPGMLFHLVNNFVGLVLVSYTAEAAAFFKEIGLGDNARDWFDAKTHLPSLLLVGSAAVLLVGAALAFQFRVKKKSSLPNHDPEAALRQNSTERGKQQR